jgi:hypothetical protein
MQGSISLFNFVVQLEIQKGVIGLVIFRVVDKMRWPSLTVPGYSVR